MRRLWGSGEFICCDESGSQRTKGVEHFALGKLLGAVLPVAGADVVGAAIARHVVECIFGRNIVTSSADNHGQLALIIGLFYYGSVRG